MVCISLTPLFSLCIRRQAPGLHFSCLTVPLQSSQCPQEALGDQQRGRCQHLCAPFSRLLRPFCSCACRHLLRTDTALLISWTFLLLPSRQPQPLKRFPNSGNLVWLRAVGSAVKDVRGDFQLPSRDNKSHTVPALPKMIYFQSAGCFQPNEVFPYQCTSLGLQRFA